MRLLGQGGPLPALADVHVLRRGGAFLMASAEMLSAIQILVYLGSVMLVVQFGSC